MLLEDKMVAKFGESGSMVIGRVFEGGMEESFWAGGNVFLNLGDVHSNAIIH